MKRTLLDKLGDFVLGKGFYIVLFLCVTAIGISGYYLMEAMTPDLTPAPAAGNPQVVVPDTTLIQPKTVIPAEPEQTKETTSPKAEQQPAEAEPSAEVQSPAEPTSISAPKEKEVSYLWPLEGELLKGFSLEVLAYDETMGDWRTHCGIDIAGDEGNKVCCIGDGTIQEIYSHDLMGTTVVVDHQNGVESVYANLSKDAAVAVGQEVERGSVLGTVGRTALAESSLPAHLHLEMRKDGNTVDPVNFLPAQ